MLLPLFSCHTICDHFVTTFFRGGRNSCTSIPDYGLIIYTIHWIIMGRGNSENNIRQNPCLSQTEMLRRWGLVVWGRM